MRVFCLLLLTGCPAIWERPVDPTDIGPTDVDTDTDTDVPVEPWVTLEGFDVRRGFLRVRLAVGDPQGIDDIVSVSISGSPDVERLDFGVFQSEWVVDVPWRVACEAIDGLLEAEVRDRSGNSGFDVLLVMRAHYDVDGVFNAVDGIPFSACGIAPNGQPDCFNLPVPTAFDLDIVADGRTTVQQGASIIAERSGRGRLQVRPPGTGLVQVCMQTAPGDRPAWAMESR